MRLDRLKLTIIVQYTHDQLYCTSKKNESMVTIRKLNNLCVIVVVVVAVLHFESCFARSKCLQMRRLVEYQT